MPIALPDEMKELFATASPDGFPCVLATAAPDGQPDIGFKGSMFVFDDEHLAYWERVHGQHLRNVEANPKVAVLYQNTKLRRGWRVFGEAQVVRDDALREKVRSRVIQTELDRDPENKGIAVLIQVNKVIQGPNVIMEREAAESRRS